MLLERFEREQFQAPMLARLRSGTRDRRAAGVATESPVCENWWSITIGDATRRSLRLRLILLWHAHLGFAVERWRVRSGPKIGEWLQAVGQIESLSSIAGYAAEHPEDVWPEIVAQGPPLFNGEGITHPLLANGVRNDIVLSPDMRLLVISGSNMSGKSTMLRSVGLNVVLAWAGMPVRARKLASLASRSRRFDARAGFDSGWQVAVLCGDHTASSNHGPRVRSNTVTVSAR